MKLPAVAIAAAYAARIAIGLHPAVAPHLSSRELVVGPFIFCDSRVDRSADAHVAELGVARGIRGHGLLGVPGHSRNASRRADRSIFLQDFRTRVANRSLWRGVHCDERE
jgi:hypothetical protein